MRAQVAVPSPEVAAVRVRAMPPIGEILMSRKQLSTTDRLYEGLRRVSRFVLRLIGSMLCVGLMW